MNQRQTLLTIDHKKIRCTKKRLYEQVDKGNIIWPPLKKQNQGFANQNHQAFETWIKLVGVLRGDWMEPNNKLKTICYGSGIAVSKRIILTCAHSIFHDQYEQSCDLVIFIPNHATGKLKKGKKIYTTPGENYIKLHIQKKQNQIKSNIVEDIALVYLSEDLQFDQYPQVGMEHLNQAEKITDIMICGFPSVGYYRCAEISKNDFERVPLYGKMTNVLGDTINYSLDTKTGHSGSPIFGITSDNKSVVIGVHTHKGKKRSTGMYLSKRILKKLARYEIQLGLAHPQYQMDIKFPNNIKQQIFNQLPPHNKKIFFNRTQYYNKMMNATIDNQKPPNQIDHDGYSQVSSQDQSVDSDQCYSEMHNIFDDEPQKISPQISTKDRIQKIMKQNSIIRQQLVKNLPYSSYRELLSSYCHIQHNFFQVFKQLNDNYHKCIYRNRSTMDDLKSFLTNFTLKLQKLNDRFDQNDQMKILFQKFPSVDDHLKFRSCFK